MQFFLNIIYINDLVNIVLVDQIFIYMLTMQSYFLLLHLAKIQLGFKMI